MSYFVAMGGNWKNLRDGFLLFFIVRNFLKTKICGFFSESVLHKLLHPSGGHQPRRFPLC